MFARYEILRIASWSFLLISHSKNKNKKIMTLWYSKQYKGSFEITFLVSKHFSQKRFYYKYVEFS